MDPDAVKSLLESFQAMAKSNQDLVAAVQAGSLPPATTAGTTPASDDNAKEFSALGGK